MDVTAVVREKNKTAAKKVIQKSGKAVAVVDCENSDPYKLYATFKNLDQDALQKVAKIVLYDDVHTASAWKFLEEYLPTIPTLERICDAFGITLAQFFAAGDAYPDLTKQQKEILEIWNTLDAREQEILLAFVRSLKK